MSKKKRNQLKRFDVLALVSSIGIIGWLMTDFFGGMVLFLLSFFPLIILINLCYTVSFVETLISFLKESRRVSKIKTIAHSAVLLSMLFLKVYHSNLFKSERIMTAVLRDDLFHFQLVFRKDGKVENHVAGVFGFSKVYYGKYDVKDSLITFLVRPYSNNFIPDTLLLDQSQNAIFIKKDASGKFQTKKEWLNHFKIE